MLINREMNKDVADIYNGIFTIRKEQNEAICSDMDRSRDYHTKWSKSDRERQLSYDITYMCNQIFKNDTNELIYKTETASQISKSNLSYQQGNIGESDELRDWD